MSETTYIIAVRPARVTPKGRTRPADYLFEFNYPGLLSDARVTITTTTDPARAKVYTEAGYREAALALLRSLGYEPAVEEVEADRV